MTFIEKLKALRNKRGISQYRLAIETGLSRSIISRWEKGDRSPKIEQLDILARYFNVDITDLFDDDTPLYRLSKRPLIDLQSAFDQLNDEGKQALLNIAFSFVYNPMYSKEPKTSFYEASYYDGDKNSKPIEDYSIEELKEIAKREKKG